MRLVLALVLASLLLSGCAAVTQTETQSITVVRPTTETVTATETTLRTMTQELTRTSTETITRHSTETITDTETTTISRPVTVQPLTFTETLTKVVTPSPTTVTSTKTLTVTDTADQTVLRLQYMMLSWEVNRRAGNGMDAKLFVTPDDESVTQKVTEIAGGRGLTANERWSDYWRLYDWVVSNISFSPPIWYPVLPDKADGTLQWEYDYWRYPKETIKFGFGHSQDMATLLTSMLRDYDEKQYAVWVINIVLGDTEGQKIGHAAVAIPVLAGQLCILDPAAKYYTKNQSGGFGSRAAATALYEWLALYPFALSPIRIFSDVEYEEFTSPDQFLRWEEARIG